MKDNIEILNAFHDGFIAKIDGELPEITLKVSIEYLRHMFSKDGDSIFLHLKGCEKLSYLNWNTKKVSSNPKEIEKDELEILDVEQVDEYAHIICSTGELDIKYDELIFELDNGEKVNFDNIAKASEKYWEDWSNKNS